MNQKKKISRKVISYVLALVIGSLVGMIMLALLKKKQPQDA